MSVFSFAESSVVGCESAHPYLETPPPFRAVEFSSAEADYATRQGIAALQLGLDSQPER